MTDQKFLKEARIAPYETKGGTWMEWREEEVADLRAGLARWINQAREEFNRAERWKLIAFAGWTLALILMGIPVIERFA